MKNKSGQIALVVGAIVFAFAICSAAILYKKFSEDYSPQSNLIGFENTQSDALSVENEPFAEQNSENVDESSSSEAESEAKTLSPAPDFTVIDYDGNEVSLSDLFGIPIVLNFWASWCAPCKSEMPDFDAAYAEHDDVIFMMVNMTDGLRETVETAKAHVEDEGYSFPVYFDTEYSAAEAYVVYSLPTTYFIDKDGNLVTRAVGMIDAETLEKGIAMISE